MWREVPLTLSVAFERHLWEVKTLRSPTRHGQTGQADSLLSVAFALTSERSLHTTYRGLIPAIDVSSFQIWFPVPAAKFFNLAKIEILPAGEEGPRRLDESTVMKIHGIPFLTVSEFIRAKLKCWIMYAATFSLFLVSLKTKNTL